MKKLFALVLVGTMISLAACQSKKAEEKVDSTATMMDSAAAVVDSAAAVVDSAAAVVDSAAAKH